MAAPPYLDRNSGGQLLSEIDAALALSVCEPELHSAGSGRTEKVSYARALISAGRIGEGFDILDPLVSIDYAPAVFAFGEALMFVAPDDGDPVEASEVALGMIEYSVELGFPLEGDDWLPFWEAYLRYHFVPDGYENPTLIADLFGGAYASRSTKSDAQLISLALQLEEECDGIAIEDSLTLQLLARPVQWSSSFVGDLAAPTNFGELLFSAVTGEDRSAINENFMARVARVVRADYHDATLFTVRHSCDSDVYETLYGNLSAELSKVMMQPQRSLDAIRKLIGV